MVVSWLSLRGLSWLSRSGFLLVLVVVVVVVLVAVLVVGGNMAYMPKNTDGN